MRKIALLFCTMIVTAVLVLSLCACNRDFRVKAKDIEKIRYTVVSSNPLLNASDEFLAEDEPELVERFASLLSEVKLNKKRASKDFWSGEELTYERPDYGMTIYVTTSGKLITLFVENNNVYKDGEFSEYGLGGNGLRAILVEATNKKQTAEEQAAA